jgi:hypothetical protein
MIKKVLSLLSIFYVLGLFSCNPGARYFRMRKSRGEVFPKENVNTMERLEKE